MEKIWQQIKEEQQVDTAASLPAAGHPEPGPGVRPESAELAQATPIQELHRDLRLGHTALPHTDRHLNTSATTKSSSGSLGEAIHIYIGRLFLK